MKRPLAWLCLVVSALAAAGAGATVLYLEPFGLPIGGATEVELRGRFGTPQLRADASGERLELWFPSAEPGIRQIRTQLVPDLDGTPRLDRLSVVYDTVSGSRAGHEADSIRARYGLGKPLWEGRDLFDGTHCRVEYYERARLSAHQTGSLALLFCHETTVVTILSHLSPRALHELAQRDGVRLDLPVPAEAGTSPLEFAAEDVIDITIAVGWPIADAEHRPVRSMIRRDGDRFVHDGRVIDPAPLAALGRSLGSLVPVTLLQDCDDGSDDRQAQDIQYPVIELAVRTRQRKLVKLRSASACAWMLPWNVSDGQHLFASNRQQTGEAIRDLVRPVCPTCRFKQGPAPQALVATDENHNRFLRLFNSLTASWDQSPDVRPRLAALRWIDGPRFEDQLRSLTRDARTPEPLRRLAAAELANAPARMRIETAMYGSNCRRAPDSLLYAAVHLAHACGGSDARRCEYVIDHRLIGDPAPGCRKSYWYRWRCPDGQAQEGYVDAEASGRRILLACPG